MDQLSVKIAIIGAGTAGLAALREARRATDDVVIIEGGLYGTTCARIGCMPSKLMIAAAAHAEAVRRAGTFGIRTEPPQVDSAAVMARVRGLRDRFVGNVMETVDAIPAAMKLEGTVRFESDNTLSVAAAGGETIVRAERVVIATGSHPVIPKEFAAARPITSDDVFEWDDLPASVAVFGAGIIGLELGQALTRLGVTVRVFGKDGGVGALTDPELVASARHHFEQVLDFVPDHELTRIVRDGNSATVDYRADGRDYSGSFDQVLVAIGRRPSLDGLNLAATSLALDEHGVPISDPCTGQCGDAPIFIAGDASDEAPLLHVAWATGRIAGANAATYPDVTAFARSVPLSVTFCEPQIAMVGETHRDLTERHADIRIGELDWAEQGRAILLDEAVGRMRIYAEKKSGHLLGAEIFGPRAEHLAHVLALALERRLTVAELLAMPFYHPTFEEGLKTALSDCRHELRMGEAPLPHGMSSGPGG